MEELIKKAKELLESQAVQMVIGYGKGTGDRVRPVFVKKPQEAESLVFDARCVHNLAVYLSKHEVKKAGKLAVVAPLSVLRAILQLAAESQITNEKVLAIGISPDMKLVDLPDFQAIEKYLSSLSLSPGEKEKDRIAALEAMTPAQRWEYWQKELSQCFKCYACRAACPLCYCSRCTVECNQPQWVPVPSYPLGNFEWHVMRAMHLAGRCVECGECGRACPLGIPVHLLTQKVSEDIFDHFGDRAGTSATLQYALSTYRTDDKENFIQ